jgi:hypothetical protein
MMLRIFRTTAAGLAALLLMLAVACGSGDGNSNESSSNEPGGDESAVNEAAGEGDPEAAVLGAVEALGRSAEGFQEQVQSLRGEMTMEMTMAGAAFGMNGDFAFKAPDQMHMQMDLSGGDGETIDLGELGSFEVLLVGDRLYMYMPLFGGWVVATLDELGVDADQYREMLNNHSPFDYGNLVESFGDAAEVQDLGDDEINGRTFRHYRIESDFASLIDALSGAFGDELSGSGILPVDGIDGGITADVWLDSDTMLPYRVTAEGSFNGSDFGEEALAGEILFKFTIEVAEYNGDVTLPDPPADAKSFAELGAGMFETE